MHAIHERTQFRKVFSRFATGVTVVTSRVGEEMHGMTCNAFCSVSLEPPTVLVSLTKGTRTDTLIERSRIFAVSILSEAQANLSDRFAGRHKDKEINRYDGIAWTTAVSGAPILKDALAYLDCRLVNVFDGGDHSLYVGEVIGAGIDEKQSPLLFYKSYYGALHV